MTDPTRAARLAQLDLGLVVLTSLAAVLVTLSDLPLALRLLLDGTLVLFLPGYALLCVLIPSRGPSVLEKLLLAVAASIGLTMLVGFGLAALGLPLDRVNWATALSAIAIGLAIVAWVRRWSRGIVFTLARLPGMPLRQAAIALLAVLVFADAVLGSRLLAGGQFGAPPEQLWLLGGGDSTAQLGLRAGPDGGDYLLRVTSAGNIVAEYSLALGQSEIWQMALALDPVEAQLPLVARLYRAGEEVEIRYVTLQPAALATDGG